MTEKYDFRYVEIDNHQYNGFGVTVYNWSCKGYGFGQVMIDNDTDEIISDEFMGDEFVKQMLEFFNENNNE